MKKLIYQIWFAAKCVLLGNEFQVNGWRKEYCLQAQQHIIQNLNIHKSNVIFEYGCGTGLHLKTISNNCKSIYGTDHSKRMVKRAKHSCAKIPNVTIVDVKSGKTGFSENQFDKTFSYSVFQYLNNINEAMDLLEEFYRVTKPNGLIYVGDIPNTIKKKPVALKTIYLAGLPIKIYNPLVILSHPLYLFFNPYKMCEYCNVHFGETQIIWQTNLPPEFDRRFGLLINIRK